MGDIEAGRVQALVVATAQSGRRAGVEAVSVAACAIGRGP
jgi:hypothetical protein